VFRNESCVLTPGLGTCLAERTLPPFDAMGGCESERARAWASVWATAFCVFGKNS